MVSNQVSRYATSRHAPLLRRELVNVTCTIGVRPLGCGHWTHSISFLWPVPNCMAVAAAAAAVSSCDTVLTRPMLDKDIHRVACGLACTDTISVFCAAALLPMNSARYDRRWLHLSPLQAEVTCLAAGPKNLPIALCNCKHELVRCVVMPRIGDETRYSYYEPSTACW